MASKTEYYMKRMSAHDNAIRHLEQNLQNITGKKRKYEEAMGQHNDYEVVQEPHLYASNRGTNWTDAYIEQLTKSKT
jgi:hypothetical protein